MDVKIFLKNKKVLEKIRINNMIKKCIEKLPIFELGNYSTTEEDLTVNFSIVKEQKNLMNKKLTTIVITKIEYII